MKLLVTGATGFLGHYVVKEALARTHQVVACGRNLELAAASLPTAQWVSIEGRDRRAFETLNQSELSIQAVVHCAARSSPWGAFEDFYQDNVVQTENLLRWMSQDPAMFLVHVSTPSLYTNPDLKPDRPFEHRESDALPRHFINAYAATKAEAEKRIQFSVQPSVVFRPRGIVGRGDRSIVPRLLRLAKRGVLPRFTDSDPRTDLTHVEDVASLLVDAAERGSSTRAKVYNVSSGEPLHLYSFLEAFMRRMGIAFRFVRIPGEPARFGIRQLERIWLSVLPGVEMPMTEMGVDLFMRDQWLNIDAVRNDYGYTPRYYGESLLEQLARDYAGV